MAFCNVDQVGRARLGYDDLGMGQSPQPTSAVTVAQFAAMIITAMILRRDNNAGHHQTDIADQRRRGENRCER